MATKFHSGDIYLGNSLFANSVFVSDQGIVTSEAEFSTSEIQQVINLKGNFLSPAFRDGHTHPLFAGRESRGLDISDCLTEAELIKKLKNYSESNAAMSWLDGAVFDRSLDMDFNRATLDKAVNDKPVVLHGDDHHTLWVNSKALEVAGLLSGRLPELDSGSIDVDDDGIPTGILRDWPAMSLVMNLAPKLTLEEDVAALLWADRKLAAAGIVECFDAWIDKGMAETYLAAWQTGELSLDYTLGFRADPITFNLELPYFLEQRATLEQTQAQVRGTSIKFFADGVFGSASALVIDPYLSTGSHGQAIWPAEKFREAIALAHKNGFQIHIHAIGDAATSLCLDVLAELENFTYPPVIAHAELTDQSLLKRMTTIGVVACVQPYWAQNNGLLLSCQKHLGKERLERLYAFNDMFESGVTTVFSSDWPISSYEPSKGLAVAVNRREHSSQPRHNFAQAVSVEQAIAAYSRNVKLMLNSAETGTLELGQPFDAVLLDQNLFEVAAEHLIKTKVLATYKAGKEIFRANL
ncbi:MAG: amidohydrolase family protein [Rhodoluna sp.]|nr:amidohydrolase family protein [Rhodoluna sp.]